MVIAKTDMWKRCGGWRGCFMALALILAGIGCQTLDPQPRSSSPPAKPGPAASVQVDPGTGPDRLRRGDKVTIEFGDVPGLAPVAQTVREDGILSLPLNVEVAAAGKTRNELAKEIEKTYVPKYYRRLTVLVKTEDRFYFVGGEVKNPSRQLYMGEMTVLKALQSAGDFTDFAQKKKVELMRSNGHREVIDCVKALRDPKKDLPVYPGDRIYVPRRRF